MTNLLLSNSLITPSVLYLRNAINSDEHRNSSFSFKYIIVTMNVPHFWSYLVYIQSFTLITSKRVDYTPFHSETIECLSYHFILIHTTQDSSLPRLAVRRHVLRQTSTELWIQPPSLSCSLGRPPLAAMKRRKINMLFIIGIILL